MPVVVTTIRLNAADRTLRVEFDDGTTSLLSAEYLRVESPSAEVQGQALYAASKQDTAKDNGEVIGAAKALISDFCDLNYQPVVLDTTEGRIIYFLATPPKAGDFVFGLRIRHARVAVQAGAEAPHRLQRTARCRTAPKHSDPQGAGRV